MRETEQRLIAIIDPAMENFWDLQREKGEELDYYYLPDAQFLYNMLLKKLRRDTQLAYCKRTFADVRDNWVESMIFPRVLKKVARICAARRIENDPDWACTALNGGSADIKTELVDGYTKARRRFNYTINGTSRKNLPKAPRWTEHMFTRGDNKGYDSKNACDDSDAEEYDTDKEE